VKKAARVIVEKYYTKLTVDFPTNKQIVKEVAQIPSVRLRNKIAGFTTHLMKRIAKGPVRGISLKLQEEERERRENVIPDHSVMEDLTANIVIDAETQELLASMGLDKLSGVTVVAAGEAHHGHHGHRDHANRGHRERRQRDRGESDMPGGKRREGRRAAAAAPATLPEEAIAAEAAAAVAATQ
jgi:small subunit ribosomal protein S17e